MRLWITKDEEGLCLWRTKPALNEDGVWWAIVAIAGIFSSWSR